MTPKENAILLFVVSLVLFLFRAKALFRREFVVHEGTVVLLYKGGKLKEVLAPGRHIRWIRGHQAIRVDTRSMLVHVPVSGIYTADGNRLDISIVLKAQITNLAKLCPKTFDPTRLLQQHTNTAIREIVERLPEYAVFEQRQEIDSKLQQILAPRLKAESIALYAASIRHVRRRAEERDEYPISGGAPSYLVQPNVEPALAH
jgi:regulator of protease activity HflC (stomatin/prohibitin superfamily)